MFGYTVGGFAMTSNTSSPQADFGGRTSSMSSFRVPRRNQSTVETFEPAMDGPPSSEHIRAYTEQMRRTSIFGANSRATTSSSGSSSRSRESIGTSMDELSRKSSVTSNSGSAGRRDRPESVQIFGKSIFSRTGRKARRENGSISNPASPNMGDEPFTVLSPTGTLNGATRDWRSAKRVPSISDPNILRSKISTPYNFQHLTHTRQDHLPNLDQTSPMELISEFSAIRASQATSVGQLKGIKTQDLQHDTLPGKLSVVSLEEQFQTAQLSPRRQKYSQRSASDRSFNRTKSYDNLRAPPRPPRSPPSPMTPITAPTRTSSRADSLSSFDDFEMLTVGTQRRFPGADFRQQEHIVSPPLPVWNEQDYFTSNPTGYVMSTLEDEAWPLVSPIPPLGYELADVQEEDEERDSGRRKSRASMGSTVLRSSQSVPAFQALRRDDIGERPVTGASCASSTVGGSPSDTTATQRRSPLSPTFQLDSDSWEDDIDYCYEHEAEADCDYQWESKPVASEDDLEGRAQKLEFYNDKSDEAMFQQQGFRPSLLMPLAVEFGDVSPTSTTPTTSLDLQIPSASPRPAPINTQLYSSSKKDSQGLMISPSLFIPKDFSSRMEHDELYDELETTNGSSDPVFMTEAYSVSPIDEAASSTASFRSSNFSRVSAQSSSSNRSAAQLRGSQDSYSFLSRTTSVSKTHESIGSTSSLPDLIPSTLRQSGSSNTGSELTSEFSSFTFTDSEEPDFTVSPASSFEPTITQRRGNNNGTLPTSSSAADMTSMLSPVVEGFTEFALRESRKGDILHGRKISEPPKTTGREHKGRARSATSSSAALMNGPGKKRGSYMLFPQV